MKTAIIIIVSALIIGFCGYQVGQATMISETQQIINDWNATCQQSEYEYEIEKLRLQSELEKVKAEIVELQNQPPEYIEVEKVVTEIKYRNISPKVWQSEEVFTEWWNSKEFYVFGDCDDWGETAQMKALSEGFPISQVLTWRGKYYNGQKVTSQWTSRVQGHIMGQIVIGNYYYVFELEHFDGLIKICRKD